MSRSDRERNIWLGAFSVCLGAAGIALLWFRSAPPVRLTHSVPLRILLSVGAASLLLLFCAWRTYSWKRAADGTDRRHVVFSRSDALLLTLLTLTALLPRWIALQHSLWYDELWTVGFMRYGPLYAVTHQGGYNNHLLNSLLGSLVFPLWKQTRQGGSTPFSAWFEWARLPALAFGTAAAPLLYAACRRYLGRPVASIAALLFALSPAAIDLSAQTRGYSAVTFFTIAQAWAFAHAVQTRRASAWLLWLACAVVGTFAHLYLIFPILIDFLLIVLLFLQQVQRAIGKASWRARLRGKRELLEQGVWMGAAWLLLTFGCYSGVLDVVREQLHKEAGTVPMARAHEVLLPLLQSWEGTPVGWLRPVSALIGAILVVSGVIHLMRRAPALGAYLLLVLILPPILVEIAKPHFVYIRFFTFAQPAFLVLTASGIYALAQFIGREDQPWRVRSVATLLTAAAIAVTLHGLDQVLRLPKQNYRDAALWTMQNRRPGQGVAMVGAGSEFLKSYGLIAFFPRSVSQLEEFARREGDVLVVDTDLALNAHRPIRPYTNYLRLHAGRPLRVFPGRYAEWSARWLDGDSDIKVYRLGNGVRQD